LSRKRKLQTRRSQKRASGGNCFRYFNAQSMMPVSGRMVARLNQLPKRLNNLALRDQSVDPLLSAGIATIIMQWVEKP
jgi:hypothetical protein